MRNLLNRMAAKMAHVGVVISVLGVLVLILGSRSIAVALLGVGFGLLAVLMVMAERRRKRDLWFETYSPS